MKTLLLGLLLVAPHASGASAAGRQADLDFVANQCHPSPPRRGTQRHSVAMR
ncbi:MAG: hypothetical protein ACLQU1_08335 [Bryobacteraceae bacterium]